MSAAQFPDSRSPAAALTAEQENRLDADLDSLREATRSLAAPHVTEAALLASFRKHHARRRRGAWLAQWFAPGIALAASVGMSAWMVLAPVAKPMLDNPSASMYAAMSAETPFIALQSLERIEAEGDARLIETSVPRAWLADYGVPVGPEVAGDSLRAEMLVSANGQPLAMRFLP